VSSTPAIPDVDFSFVRYANCWEDPRLLIAALNPAPGRRILSIASAGDNSLSLVAHGAQVIAADLNPTQLACAELRKEAIRALPQEAFLAFAGITESHDARATTYQSIRPHLTPATQRYWDSQTATLQLGFIHSGKFENYFQLFRKRVLPLIQRRRTIAQLLEPKSPDARVAFYQEVWNNRRWRMLFKLFFSRQLMGKLGRDPEFFRHVEGEVSARILERAEYALTTLDTATNPYLTYILTGNFAPALPHYLEPENYNAIRSHIDNLELRHGAIDAIAEEYGAGSFDGYNLSDIFEYLSPDQCTDVYARLLAAARPHARLAYWNMLVPRSCPTDLADRVTSLTTLADDLFKTDQAFFYSRFVVEETQ
jgi:S-adenosylmethionine-diacylglycerol 3-amino-3-carboxypropyl transferase